MVYSDVQESLLSMTSLRGLTLAVAGAAVLGFQVKAADNVAEDVVLSPAAGAPPVAARLRPRRFGRALQLPAAQLVQRLV